MIQKKLRAQGRVPKGSRWGAVKVVHSMIFIKFKVRDSIFYKIVGAESRSDDQKWYHMVKLV